MFVESFTYSINPLSKGKEMSKSSIPPEEAHLYETPAEAWLIRTGFVSVIMACYYIGVSIAERSWTFGWPIGAVAAVSGAIAAVLYYVCRATWMYLQPGNPRYVGRPTQETIPSE